MLQSTKPDTTFVPQRLSALAPYFAFAVAVLLAFGNVYNNAFLDDDKVLITRNIFLIDWDHLRPLLTSSITAGASMASGFYRPVQMVIYLFMVHAFGLSSFAFHLLNLILHILNACLLYRLALGLNFNARGAFFAVLIWSLHPVQVEAVTYMSGTADPLYVFFTLAALLTLPLDLAPRRIFLALPLLVLALLSKEDAVIFPLLATLCLAWVTLGRLKFRTVLRIQLRLWPLWLTVVLCALAHRYLLSFGNYKFYPDNLPYTSSLLPRLFTCLATLPSYLGFIVWPTHLHFGRNIFPVMSLWRLPAIAGLAIVLAATAQIYFARRHASRALSWGLLWFAAAHALHTGIAVPLNSMLLEHWLYLPTAGLFLGIAEYCAVGFQFKRPKGVVTACVVVLTVTLGLLTYRQNTIWYDEEGFYLNIFTNGEPSLEAHDNLGAVYTEHGDYQKAIAQFQNVIDLTQDQNAPAEYNLAVALLFLRNQDFSALPDVIAHMRRALEIDPQLYEAAEKLALIYARMGDTRNATIYRDRAAAIQANFVH